MLRRLRRLPLPSASPPLRATPSSTQICSRLDASPGFGLPASQQALLGHTSAHTLSQHRRFSSELPRGSELKERLLQAALQRVPDLGWSADMLRSAAKDQHMSVAAAGLLSRGPVEVVEYFNTKCDKQLAHVLSSKAGDLAELRTHQRLAFALKTRLDMIQPYLSTWPVALGLQALLQNVPYAIAQRASLMDEIWHAAGDRTSDASWYAKRAALAAVYSSTELYMLRDSSSNLESTWQFLEERLRDMADAGQSLRSISDASAFFMAPVKKS